MANSYCFGRVFEVVLTLVVCLGSATFADEPELPRTLDGLEFQSIKKFEVSVLPTGPVTAHRILKFKDGEFTYSRADYIDSGKYDWNAKRGEIEAASQGEKKYKGKYNPKTKILTWDGARYKVQAPKKSESQDSTSKSTSE